MHLQPPIPAFSDNYIWWFQTAEGPVVVDPGQAAPVFAVLGERRPAAVLITHHHADHIGGLPELKERWPGLRIVAPDDARIALASERVAPGQTFTLAGEPVTAMAGPGHTLSHLAYMMNGVLFPGDIIFSLGCGRLFEGTPAQMLHTLDRITALPGATRVLSAHEYTQDNARFAFAVEPGNPALRHRMARITELRAASQPTLPTTITQELLTNPFLRLDSEEVQASVAQHTGRAPETRLETFTALRRWKDGFSS